MGTRVGSVSLLDSKNREVVRATFLSSLRRECQGFIEAGSSIHSVLEVGNFSVPLGAEARLVNSSLESKKGFVLVSFFKKDYLYSKKGDIAFCKKDMDRLCLSRRLESGSFDSGVSNSGGFLGGTPFVALLIQLQHK